MTVWSFCEDLNLFPSNNNDDISFDAIEPSFSDNLFSGNSESNVDDDLFATDDSLNTEIPLPNDSVDHVSADDHPNCSASSTLSRRIRARLDSCPANPPSKERYLDVRTDEDVKKYWCSETGLLGFGNIPVCNLLPTAEKTSVPKGWTDFQTSPPPVVFYILPLCRMSKFISLFGAIFEFSRIAEEFESSEVFNKICY